MNQPHSPARRRHPRGSALRNFLIVLALGIAAYKYGRPYLEKPPALHIQNKTAQPMEGVKVLLSTPDAFGELANLQKPVELGRMEPGSKVEVPFGVEGTVKVEVVYQMDFKDYASARPHTVKEGVNLLLEVKRPGSTEFTEGNGWW